MFLATQIFAALFQLLGIDRVIAKKIINDPVVQNSMKDVKKAMERIQTVADNYKRAEQLMDKQARSNR